MRKLNGKNKFFILIFSIIIILIIALLIYSIKLSKHSNDSIYNVSTNTVIFDSESNLIDTSAGGNISLKWNDIYYYIDNNNESYDIGLNPVIFEKTNGEISLLGDNYQVSSDGNVIKNTKITSVSNIGISSFYKLDDRVYLIISDEIYNLDKTVYASKYLIVYIDKMGNAKILNDSININTINPMSLIFDTYTFDIANEKLIIKDKSIDLKLINGSTNQYVPKDTSDEKKPNINELIESYNHLVNDFTQYVKNDTLVIGSNNNIADSNKNEVNDSKDNNSGQLANNNISITKKVSLRGAIAYPTYIDVSYIITDPYDVYQGVYLLITGYINGTMTTEKIMLDKYNTTYRIGGLTYANEYSISLGYIEVVTDGEGKKSLVDNIEDVINVRTSKCDMSLEILKIANGRVYFNFKMTENFELESGKISLYSDDEFASSVNINCKLALSEKGFDSNLELVEGNILQLKLENPVYNSQKINLNIYKKFAYLQ